MTEVASFAVASEYRSIDGSGNNVADPGRGAANTLMSRGPEGVMYADGFRRPIDRGNERTISRRLFLAGQALRPEEMAEEMRDGIGALDVGQEQVRVLLVDRSTFGACGGVVAAGPVRGEAEPRQLGGQGQQVELVAVQDVTDDVAHTPAVAQRRPFPVVGREGVQVGGELGVLLIVERAVVDRRHLVAHGHAV